MSIREGAAVMPKERRARRPVVKSKIITGLEEAVEFARGDKASGRATMVAVPDAVDVPAIRRRLNMSQHEFALRFGFSLGTLRNWEQGRRIPRGPERVLLTIIDRIPEQVEEALRVA